MRSVIVGCALVFAGCVLVKPTNPYVGVSDPLMFEARAGTPPGKSSPPEAGEPLTLDRAISIALANNPDVSAAAHAVDMAGAARDMVAAERLPRIGASAGYVRHLDDQRLVPPSRLGETSIFAGEILSGDIVASVPLFTGGRLTNEVRAADLERDSRAHRLGRSRHELVYNVTTVFFDILAQRRVVESLEFSREALREHLRRVEEMIAVGKAAPVDRLRTEVRLADIEQRLAWEEGFLSIRERVLGTLLGLAAHEVSGAAVVGDLEPIGSDPFDSEGSPDLSAALEYAYERRGDYLAARTAVEAEARRVDAARAGYLPTLLLHGAYGGRVGLDAADVPGDGGALADAGRVGALLDIPLFEGGRTRARVARERASLGVARERLRELTLRVRLDVESALVSIHSAGQRARATAKASEQAEESLRIERERYALARASITDVLDAQAALLEAQTSHYRALADQRTARSELALAMGDEL